MLRTRNGYRWCSSPIVAGNDLLKRMSLAPKNVSANCPAPDDSIDPKRYPLFMARAVMRSLFDELLAGRSPGPSAHSIKESADIARAEPPFAVGNKGFCTRGASTQRPKV